jgi:hypothetical protein
MHRRYRGLTQAALMAATMSGSMLAAQAPATPAAPQLTISGVAYAQYNYNISGDLHVNAFDVTRTYINFNGKFGGGVSTRITPDIYRNADGSAAYRLKYGYVAYAPGAGKTVYKFGMIHTPWVSREEDIWDYRMQGGIATERANYLSSSDLGVSVDTRVASDRLDLSFGIYNGETYKKAETDQRKDFMARASLLISATDDASAAGGLRLTGFAMIGRPAGGGNRDRYIGMLSYKSKLFTLAGEYAVVTDSSTTAPTPETNGSVISVFGVYRVPNSKVAFLARLDQIDPNTDLDNDANTRVIAGASYQLSPNLRLLADVDLLSHEAGDPDAPIDARNQALFQLQFTF